jgi:hypothetical protein
MLFSLFINLFLTALDTEYHHLHADQSYQRVDVINSWQLFQELPNVPELTDDDEPFVTVGQDAVPLTLAKLQWTPAAVSLLIDPAYETAFSYVYRRRISLWDRPPHAPFV